MDFAMVPLPRDPSPPKNDEKVDRTRGAESRSRFDQPLITLFESTSKRTEKAESRVERVGEKRIGSRFAKYEQKARKDGTEERESIPKILTFRENERKGSSQYAYSMNKHGAAEVENWNTRWFEAIRREQDHSRIAIYR
jgi:hypothetical protein